MNALLVAIHRHPTVLFGRSIFSPLQCLLPKQIFPYITTPPSTRLIEFHCPPSPDFPSAVNQSSSPRTTKSHASRCPPRSLSPYDRFQSQSRPRPPNLARTPCRRSLCYRLFTHPRVHLWPPVILVSPLVSPTNSPARPTPLKVSHHGQKAPNRPIRSHKMPVRRPRCKSVLAWCRGAKATC